MLNKLYFFSFLAFTLLLACKTEQQDGKKLDVGNYNATLIHDEDTALPVQDQFVHFHLDMYDNDEHFIMSSHNKDFMPVVKLMPRDQIEVGKNPIMDMLYQLSIGDTARISIPIDSIPSPSEEMKSTPIVKYYIMPKMIQSEEEYTAFVKGKVDEQISLAEEQVFKYMAGKKEGQEIPSGTDMKIILLEEGEGETAKQGQGVMVHYSGYTRDSNNFDNSFQRGKPITFQVGMQQVIQGWDVGLTKLNKGAKAILDIPPSLGYGKAGSPPAIIGEQDLIFYVELVNIFENQ